MKPEDFADEMQLSDFSEQHLRQPLRRLWSDIGVQKWRSILSSNVNNEFIVDWYILQAERHSDKISYVASSAAQLAVLLDRHRQVP